MELRNKIIGLVESRLGEILTPRYPELIYEAMAYSVFAGGKRLRPLLLLAAYGAAISVAEEPDFTGTPDFPRALDFACAIEMIHSYSLIHDDLPAMDNDDFRRGKPTNHRVYGDAVAILAGDALLNTAFEVMSAAILRADGDRSRQAARAMGEITRAAGTGGMLGGQVVDMQYENREADAAVLSYIHANKTGALIRSAVVSGAILGGADAETCQKLDAAAGALGLAFQIKDDILDITSTGRELGKPVGSDVKNRKLTYPSMYGMERSREDYDRLSREAVGGMETLFGRDALLTRLAEEMTARDK